MRTPKIAVVFDRKGIASPTKEAPVEVRTSFNYKKIYMRVGINLKSNE